MSGFHQKITRDAKSKQKQFKEIKLAAELDSDMTQVLGLYSR